MKTAVITGVSGQDGSYIAELLLSKGYRVIGTTRDTDSVCLALPKELREKIELVDWNGESSSQITEIIKNFTPDEIYNLAAYSSGMGMYDDSVAISEINGLGVTRILEGIRSIRSSIRFCQASSREIFGEATESPQTEKTVPRPRSPYGAAKLYADNMIRIYREKYGIYACSAILFNHESPRRGLQFVTRKITHAAAKIKMGQATMLELGNLDAQRDWGYAGDYVYAMWLMLKQKKPSDYVIATGRIHSVREFCQIAFDVVGLNYEEFVVAEQSHYRPSEKFPLVGDASKAANILNWTPKVGFEELVKMMVNADLKSLTKKNY